MPFFTDRGSRWSLLLVLPASRAPVLLTGAPSYPTPPHRLPPRPPSISTPHQPSPTSPAPTLTPPPIIPPPPFHTSTPPSPSANSPPPPSFAPPDPGPPASPPPQRPPPRSPSAPHRRRASATCRPPARSHMHTCRPNQSGMNIIYLGYDITNLKRVEWDSSTLITPMHLCQLIKIDILANCLRDKIPHSESKNMST